MVREAGSAPVLPATIVGLVDIGRLIRELEKLEQALQASEIRAQATTGTPKVSALLDQLSQANGVDLSQAHDRKSLLEFLQLVRRDAPRVHVSFSADPSPLFLSKLMTWFRSRIHPLLLVAIGLQPGIGAGCMLRTTNRYFDMSLGKSFTTHRQILIDRLRQGVVEPTPAAVAVSPQAAPTQQAAAQPAVTQSAPVVPASEVAA